MLCILITILSHHPKVTSGQAYYSLGVALIQFTDWDYFSVSTLGSSCNKDNMTIDIAMKEWRGNWTAADL